MDCTGDNLPQEIPLIQIEETPSCLDDFCQTIQFENEVLLYEVVHNKNRTYYYWFILEADDFPLGVCELEKYANFAEKKDQWSGERADYLIVGSNEGDCYLIVIELRHVLVKEEQLNQKVKQLLESIERILKIREVINNSQTLEEVYKNPDSYKIIGAIVAPAGTKNFPLKKRSFISNVNSHKVLIRVLPKDALSDCKITWTDFLQRMGVLPDRKKGKTNSEFNIPTNPKQTR